MAALLWRAIPKPGLRRCITAIPHVGYKCTETTGAFGPVSPVGDRSLAVTESTKASWVVGERGGHSNGHMVPNLEKR